MPHSRERRRKYFVSQVQAAILRQAAYYWLFGLLVYTLVVAVFRIIPACFSIEGAGLNLVWYHLSPMFIASAVLAPVLMVSAVRFSHRFVGPIIRFRQVLKQLARGEAVPAVELRRGDYWQDVASELNKVSAKLGRVQDSAPARDSAPAKDSAPEQAEQAVIAG